MSRIAVSRGAVIFRMSTATWLSWSQSEAAEDVSRDFDLERDEVRLLDYDPDAEIRLVAAALYPYSNRSEEDLLKTAIGMSDQERRDVLSTYVGERSNRRHKPGRGMERIYYRFDVLSDFGSFPRPPTASNDDDRLAAIDASPWLLNSSRD